MVFAPINNEIVEKSGESFLVDFQGENEVLAICFGFYDATCNNQFDFYKRLKKLEVLSGKKVSKLLLRDRQNAWYHYGVPPLGNNVDDTVAALRKIIAEIKPSQIFTIGQSMGAYAAIVFGALLDVDKVISFGPLSCFDVNKLEILRDYRWIEIAKKVESNPPKVFYNDLPALIKAHKGKTIFEIFYGTNPGVGASRSEAVNFDAAHALAFSEINNVKLFPAHTSPHAIVEYFRANKIINDMLLNRMFGTRPAAEMQIAAGPEWAKWLEENIRLGCSDEQLLQTLAKNNFTSENAAIALSSVHAKAELARIIG